MKGKIKTAVTQLSLFLGDLGADAAAAVGGRSLVQRKGRARRNREALWGGAFRRGRCEGLPA